MSAQVITVHVAALYMISAPMLHHTFDLLDADGGDLPSRARPPPEKARTSITSSAPTDGGYPDRPQALAGSTDEDMGCDMAALDGPQDHECGSG